jgi:hypothetical protein
MKLSLNVQKRADIYCLSKVNVLLTTNRIRQIQGVFCHVHFLATRVQLSLRIQFSLETNAFKHG